MLTPFSTTSAPVRHWIQTGPCQRIVLSRWVSSNAESHTVHSPRSFIAPSTFESAGIRAPIASALRSAFPNVQNPTKAQSEFIPAVLSGKDVLLKDETGTGKSFGVILALLSKARKRAAPSSKGIVHVKPFITSLVIVPHRDLAHQFHHWIERLVHASASPGREPPPLASIAQVIVRGGETPISTQKSAVLENPPHILIGTPNALVELFDESLPRAQLRSISSVYVDEVDYLIESVPTHSTRRSEEKIRRRMEKHPGATSQLLDILFASRRQKWEAENAGDHHVSKSPSLEGPQLIMSSATLRVPLNKQLTSGRGWMDRSNLIKVTGDGRRVSENPSVTEVAHCVLLVSKNGDIRNIDGAKKPISIDIEEGREITEDDIFNSPDIATEVQEELADKFAGKELQINRNALETVATAFALDVPSVALLSLPATAPVQRIVQELRELGVNAHSLDLLTADKGRAHLLQGATAASEENPVLLVSTLATTRGLDLPELTHVFMLGLPAGRRADAYLHIAGRVGRFGRGGKVVTIVEAREEEQREDGTLAWVKDEPKRMSMLLNEIGVTPTQLEHFD